MAKKLSEDYLKKKKYTEKDYEDVLNHILEAWSGNAFPEEDKIMRNLKTKKKLMDKEYTFYKEMSE